MIDKLSVTSPFLTTNAYGTPTVVNHGQGAGAVRFNINCQQLEVFDGSVWINISQTAIVGLSREADEVLRWGGYKMREDDELAAKMTKYPTLKSAYDQFKMVEALVYKEENDGT